MGQNANSNADRTADFARETAAVFLGILLALTLTAALDGIFEGISQYRSGTQVFHALWANRAWSALLGLQLAVFVLTVFRFYWGTARYHDEISDAPPTLHFILGLAGEIFVFSIFYVTALAVRSPSLFTEGLGLAFAADLLWFSFPTISAARRPTDAWPEIHKIWRWYLSFDVLSILAIAAFMIVAYSLPCAARLCDALSLLSVAGVGAWDLVKFWSYYTKQNDWKQKLARNASAEPERGCDT